VGRWEACARVAREAGVASGGVGVGMGAGARVGARPSVAAAGAQQLGGEEGMGGGGAGAGGGRGGRGKVSRRLVGVLGPGGARWTFGIVIGGNEKMDCAAEY
jgi:hypothetical protein